MPLKAGFQRGELPLGKFMTILTPTELVPHEEGERSTDTALEGLVQIAVPFSLRRGSEWAATITAPRARQEFDARVYRASPYWRCHDSQPKALYAECMPASTAPAELGIPRAFPGVAEVLVLRGRYRHRDGTAKRRTPYRSSRSAELGEIDPLVGVNDRISGLRRNTKTQRKSLP